MRGQAFGFRQAERGRGQRGEDGLLVVGRLDPALCRQSFLVAFDQQLAVLRYPALQLDTQYLWEL